MLEKNNFGNMIKDTLVPIVLYFLVNQLLAFAFMRGLGLVFTEELIQSTEITSLVKMLAMAVGGMAVYPYYKKNQSQRNGKIEGEKITHVVLLKIAIIGSVMSLVLNSLFAWSGFLQSSDSYQEVAKVQFSLSILPAMIFYALVSPLVEELVFRGIVFGALENYLSQKMAIFCSALLFGVFHGNIVQMLYGTIMGMVMAYLYSRYRKLIAPIVFHGAANAAIYLCTYYF